VQGIGRRGDAFEHIEIETLIGVFFLNFDGRGTQRSYGRLAPSPPACPSPW